MFASAPRSGPDLTFESSALTAQDVLALLPIGKIEILQPAYAEPLKDPLDSIADGRDEVPQDVGIPAVLPIGRIAIL